MNAAWALVLFGGVFETVWAFFLHESDGFTNLTYTALAIVFIFVSTYFLNKGLKAGLPVGPCYAVWVGIGAIGSIIVDIVIFDRMLSLVGWTFLAMVIAGVLGLNMLSDE